MTGMNKDDIEISLSNSELSLKGEKKRRGGARKGLL
jgi:HSP20 family molecular chaperone IbpA